MSHRKISTDASVGFDIGNHDRAEAHNGVPADAESL